MRRTIAPILLALLAAGARAEVTITGATVVDRGGNAIRPKVGEPFSLVVGLHVSGQGAPYRVVVDAPSGTLDTGAVAYGVNAPGDYWVGLGEIVPLYDGPMDVTVSCAAAKATLRLRVVPVSPAAAFETYDPQRLQGVWSASVVLDRPTRRLLAWLPLPESGGFQGVAAVSAPAWQARSKEAAQPVGLVQALRTDRIAVSAAATTTAASVRTNLAALRAVPMGAVPKGAWLAPEARVESASKEIVAFAKAATKGMGPKTPVADVALALYSAVLSRSTYALTGAPPDALVALRSGRGECGDLSALFVAACRAVGVPARPVSGFVRGVDDWHVWAEFLVPGLGWVPVDPAYALGRRPHAATPLYFGVVPDLRDRVALCYGFTQTVGDESTTFLQTPQVFTFEKGPRVRTAVFGCALQPAP